MRRRHCVSLHHGWQAVFLLGCAIRELSTQSKALHSAPFWLAQGWRQAIPHMHEVVAIRVQNVCNCLV